MKVSLFMSASEGLDLNVHATSSNEFTKRLSDVRWTVEVGSLIHALHVFKVLEALPNGFVSDFDCSFIR